MMILVDSNILLRIAQKSNSMFPAAFGAVASLKRQGTVLVLLHQNMAEFYVVATRPTTARGGLGMSSDRALAFLDRFKSVCKLLPDQPHYDPWEALIGTSGSVGVIAHDARIVAHMRQHGVNDILSFNDRDFSRFGVVVHDPYLVSGIAPPTVSSGKIPP